MEDAKTHGGFRFSLQGAAHADALEINSYGSNSNLVSWGCGNAAGNRLREVNLIFCIVNAHFKVRGLIKIFE